MWQVQLYLHCRKQSTFPQVQTKTFLSTIVLLWSDRKLHSLCTLLGKHLKMIMIHHDPCCPFPIKSTHIFVWNCYELFLLDQSIFLSWFRQDDVFTGENNIMDRGLLKYRHGFVSYKHTISSQNLKWWSGVVWITCGLLWCFYQLFELSFWRHPFTADPLVSKWYNLFWWRNKPIYILQGLRVKHIFSTFSLFEWTTCLKQEDTICRWDNTNYSRCILLKQVIIFYAVLLICTVWF